MDVFETLVVSVPAIVIVAIGGLFALRYLFRRRMSLIRIGIAALMVGCAFSAAYFWNMTVTPHLLQIELTERQQELLAQLELPKELEELSAKQKKAVVRIDEMLTYLEEKHDLEFRYSGYTAGELFGEEKLTAFPVGGNPLTDTVTVKTDNWGDFTDDFAWVRSKGLYNAEVKKLFESNLKENCAKVLTISGEASVANVRDLTLEQMSGCFQADTIVFIRGNFTKEQLEAATEAFGSWASSHGLWGHTQVLQLDAKQAWSTISEKNYKEFIVGNGAGIRVSCSVKADGSFRIN